MCPRDAIDSLPRTHSKSDVRTVDDHKKANQIVTINDRDHHEERDQKPEESINEGEYWTEGIRNPGWITVAGIWMMYFVSAGATNVWGIFQAEYIKMYSNEVPVSFIGSTTVSILQLGILISPLIRRIGVRYTMLLGTLVSTVALILASFAIELWQLFATQGVMYGIGLCFVFNTPTTLSSQWFVKKRALANGISWSGATIGPIVFSNSFQALLTVYGRQVTLATMAGIVFIVLLISAILSKPRYPVLQSLNNNHLSNVKDDMISSEKYLDTSLMSMRFLIILFLSFTFPFHWQTILFLAPTYAQYVGASPALAASLITIIFAMASISRIAFGYAADRCGRLNILTTTLFLNAIFIITLWQFSDTVRMFAIFCGLFGLLGGVFPLMRPVVTSDLVGMRKAQKAVCLSYLFSIPATLVGDPLIAYIYSRHGWTVAIQTIGTFAAVSAFAALAARFTTNKQFFAIV